MNQLTIHSLWELFADIPHAQWQALRTSWFERPVGAGVSLDVTTEFGSGLYVVLSGALVFKGLATASAATKNKRQVSVGSGAIWGEMPSAGFTVGSVGDLSVETDDASGCVLAVWREIDLYNIRISDPRCAAVLQRWAAQRGAARGLAATSRHGLHLFAIRQIMTPTCL